MSSSAAIPRSSEPPASSPRFLPPLVDSRPRRLALPVPLVQSELMIIQRRDLLAGSAATTLLAAHRPLLAQSAPITPEQFGAAGDGRTNDTAAFARMAAFVNQRGGGEIALRRTTHIVGAHLPVPEAGYAFPPAKVMDFIGCTRPLTIRGNGARIRSASGLRYGTFDPRSGQPTRHPMPYIQGGELATPYRAMVVVENCAGPVEISDLELDGNLAGLRIGGQYGDTGWQIPASGIWLINNLGSERLLRISSHHHAQDGVYIDGSPARAGAGLLQDVTSEYNGRQGCSLVGGRNYSFERCRFNHTGKAGLESPPRSGLDIEAEGGKTIRNLRFVACEFSNNMSTGIVADNGDSEGAVFERCRFIGTTGWAAWPKKPRFRFLACEFVGAIVHAFGDKDPDRAAQFHDCLFRDDPALSPTGEVYNAAASSPIADLPNNPNVLFNRCRFLLTHRLVLPWTTNVVTFADCVMSQAAAKQSYPRGTFIGRNRIDGNVGLYSARIRGELIVNGKLVPPTTH